MDDAGRPAKLAADAGLMLADLVRRHAQHMTDVSAVKLFAAEQGLLERFDQLLHHQFGQISWAAEERKVGEAEVEVRGVRQNCRPWLRT